MPKRINKKVRFAPRNDAMELCDTEDTEMRTEDSLFYNGYNDQLLYQILGLIRNNGHFCGIIEYNDGMPYLDWCGYNNCIIRE